MGAEEVPWVILLPHHNGTAEYGLVGLVATNTPNHVVAYIPKSRHKDTEWVMIDGMVQKVQRAPIDPHKIILCLYRRLVPEMVPEEDEMDEEDPHGRNGERDGRTQTSAHESPSHSQSQQWEEAPDDSNMIDQCGRCAYGQPPGSAPHSSQSVPSLPSSQTLTQDPFLMPIAPRKRGRRKEEPREEEEEEGTRGTVIICEEDEEELVTQSVPPPPSS
ncbi:hypothetical protein MOQ_009122, partial [Trypanosoma cruzi marinkellei]